MLTAARDSGCRQRSPNDPGRRRLPGGRSGGRTLDGELARVALLWRAINLLQDELANAHTRLQEDRQRAGIPDFKLNGIADERGIKIRVAEPCVNGRAGQMHPQPETRQAALSPPPAREPRAMGKLNALEGPAKVEPTGFDRPTFRGGRQRTDEPSNQLCDFVIRVSRREPL